MDPSKPSRAFTRADGSFEILLPSTGHARLELFPADEHSSSWTPQRDAATRLEDVNVPSEGVLLVPPPGAEACQ